MTTTLSPTLQQQINKANPNNLADLLRQVALGDVLAGTKRAFTGLTAAGAFDLTAIDGTGEVVGASNPKRRALLGLKSLRVTAATTANTVGSYTLTDAAGTKTSPTASTVVGIAQISDDGKTITFPTADVTAFVIEYIPASLVVPTTVLPGDEGEP